MTSVRFTTADGVDLVGDLQSSPVGAGVAVVCHPLTTNGGTMASGLVPLMQRALVHAGWTTLRFDFRGAGASGGRFGRGVGELEDLAAAIEEVRRHGDGPLLLAGWSFGAAVTLRHTVGHDDVAAWLGVALPVGLEGLGIPQVRADDLRGMDRPLRFVHGTADDVAPVYRVRALAEVAPAGELVPVEDGDHFLQDRRTEVDEAVRRFADDVRAS